MTYGRTENKRTQFVINDAGGSAPYIYLLFISHAHRQDSTARELWVFWLVVSDRQRKHCNRLFTLLTYTCLGFPCLGGLFSHLNQYYVSAAPSQPTWSNALIARGVIRGSLAPTPPLSEVKFFVLIFNVKKTFMLNLNTFVPPVPFSDF